MKYFLTLFFLASVYLLNAQNSNTITPNSVGDISLGDSIALLQSKFPSESLSRVEGSQFALDGPGEGWLVIINESDSLMFVWSKDYGKTVGGIICLSDAFKTEDHLGIGSTLGEIEKKHPNIMLRPDFMNESIEYITVKYNDGFINFQTISSSGTQIGQYDIDPNNEPETKKFDRSATVDRLTIWK